MRLHPVLSASLIAAFFISTSESRVLRLRVERREPVLNGKAWGSAGSYERLVGTVEFALDPMLTINQNIVDLKLAPRNARGEVEFTADFYILKPVEPARSNGRVFYEVGNRGSKSILTLFQDATSSFDPTSSDQIGDGRLMKQGYTLAWIGWQWDVPDGRMRMNMPIATDHGKPITGLVRANFIPDNASPTQLLADRGHRSYPIDDPDAPENAMTVRDRPTDSPRLIPRAKWHFVDGTSVAVDGGFEAGRIYDVVYRARDPRVVGTGLAGTRDFVSFLKYNHTEANPVQGIRTVDGWGLSQSGRFLRHFLYEGFNEDEQGRQVFDGIIDEAGGAGRGSFNYRFAQASRDALEFFNIFYPVDMFPFTDGVETDPETGKTGSLLGRAKARHVAPKVMHILSNSEYFNRAGSLIHTDPAGTRDIEPSADSRIYAVASDPHFAVHGPAKPAGAAALGNPLDRGYIVIALLKHLDAWVAEGTPPPPSRFPHVADGTLVPTEKARWPGIPGVPFPVPNIKTYRLDWGPRWEQGIADYEPPKVGKPFVGLVPAVDANGNVRAGIRMPAIEVPVGTYSGWNFRAPAIGASDQLFKEFGSFYPFPCTATARTSSGDSRTSIAERYSSRDDYVSKIKLAAQRMLKDGFLLPEDLNDIVDDSVKIYDWTAKSYCKQ
jgi:hypothetical protein